ncbi:YcxB family protein [Microbacterium sp. MM2322]|jgi:hypothetical protein|uniref:YcxB family protein n=1 Tax=Microbacterium sp. MM2322 TaxID=3157631 RepID=UPI0032D59844
MADAAVQETTTGKSMVINRALTARLARDHQRTKEPGLWAAGIALFLLLGVGMFALNGNFRSLVIAGFWAVILVIALFSVRRMGSQKLTRVIEGIYPHGDRLTVAATDAGLTVTTSATSLTVAASAIWRVSTAPNSVMVRITGLTGPAIIVPRELLDDADVSRLRAAAPRIRRP